MFPLRFKKRQFICLCLLIDSLLQWNFSNFEVLPQKPLQMQRLMQQMQKLMQQVHALADDLMTISCTLTLKRRIILMSIVQHKWICLPFLLPQSATTCKHSHLHSLSSCPVWFVREALELQTEVRKQSQMVPISAHLTSPFSRTTKNFKKQTRACNQLNMRESVWKCVVMCCPTNIIKPHQTHPTTNYSAIMKCSPSGVIVWFAAKRCTFVLCLNHKATEGRV